MLAQPVACPFDLDNYSMTQQSVQQSGPGNGVTEHVGPFSKAVVGCQDHSPFLIPGVDKLEEEIGPIVALAAPDGQIAYLVNDQQSRP